MSDMIEASGAASRELKALLSAALLIAQHRQERRNRELREELDRNQDRTREAERRMSAEGALMGRGAEWGSASHERGGAPAVWDSHPGEGLTGVDLAERWAAAQAPDAAPEDRRSLDEQVRGQGVDPSEVRADAASRWDEGAPRTAGDSAVATTPGHGPETGQAGQGIDPNQVRHDAATFAGAETNPDETDAERKVREEVESGQRFFAKPLPGQERTGQSPGTEDGAVPTRTPGQNSKVNRDLALGEVEAKEHDVAAEQTGHEGGIWQDGAPAARLAGQGYTADPAGPVQPGLAKSGNGPRVSRSHARTQTRGR